MKPPIGRSAVTKGEHSDAQVRLEAVKVLAATHPTLLREDWDKFLKQADLLANFINGNTITTGDTE